MYQRAFLAATLLALLVLAGIGWGGWWQARQALVRLAFPQQRLAFLEAETHRLQSLLIEQQRAADATENRQRRREIESSVERLRALSFLRPVAYREIPRADLPNILRAKLGQQVPDQEFDRTGVALAALGLIPPGIDLKKTYLGLLGEQVGAFYDQHSQELFTFRGQGFGNSQNQVILAHELTHALEDQHFHLARLPLEAKGNDDRAMAASALVEGDATLVMNRYLLGALNAASIRESLAATVTTDVRQLAAAPRFLRETLLFPYLRGQEFCQALYDQGGWPELARAFDHPPASTALILHPERFLAEPSEEPTPIEFANGEILGEQPIDDNVLGEFGARQWLLAWLKDEGQATATAAGWKADRYLVYGGPHAASFVWETVWRSPHEAEAFGEAARRALDGGPARQPRLAASAGPAPDVGGTSAGPWNRGTHTLLLSVDTARQRVLIIDAQDVRWFEAMRNRFAGEFDSAAARAAP